MRQLRAGSSPSRVDVHRRVLCVVHWSFERAGAPRFRVCAVPSVARNRALTWRRGCGRNEQGGRRGYLVFAVWSLTARATVATGGVRAARADHDSPSTPHEVYAWGHGCPWNEDDDK